MRLTCPDCGAQYEVDQSLIPTAGRDVQCSNCSNTWFQEHPDAVAKDEYSHAFDDAADEGDDAETSDGDAHDHPAPSSADATDTPSDDGFQIESLMSSFAAEAKAAEEKAAEEKAAAEQSVAQAPKTSEDDASASQDDEADQSAVAAEPEESTPQTSMTDETAPDADASDKDLSREDALSETAKDSLTAALGGGAKAESKSDETDDDDTEEPSATQPDARRDVDPAVMSILREEAELETGARRAEAEGLESQPDLGLEDPAPRGGVRGLMASAFGGKSNAAREARNDADEPVKPKLRNKSLPDIDLINATLRAAAERGPEEDVMLDMQNMSKSRHSGFRFGFVTMLLITATLAAIYLLKPQIIGYYPDASPYLETYVVAVDHGRAALSDLTEMAISAINKLAGATDS